MAGQYYYSKSYYSKSYTLSLYISASELVKMAIEQCGQARAVDVINRMKSWQEKERRTAIQQTLRFPGEMEWALVKLVPLTNGHELELEQAGQALRLLYGQADQLDAPCTEALTNIARVAMRRDENGKTPRYGKQWLTKILECRPDVLVRGSEIGGAFWINYSEDQTPRDETEVRLMKVWFDRMANLWEKGLEETRARDEHSLAEQAKNILNNLGVLWDEGGGWTQWRESSRQRVERIEQMTDAWGAEHAKGMLSSIKRQKLAKIAGKGVEVKPHRPVF